MGACATKLSGDQKDRRGEPPLIVEDGVAPAVAEGEKVNKADGVPAAAEATDPADVSRRRSLSDLLKEDAGASDEEAGQEAVTVVTVDSVVATDDEAGAQASLSREGEAAEVTQQVAVEPSAGKPFPAEQGAAAGQLTDDHETGKELIGGGRREACGSKFPLATVAALGAEGSEVAGGASA